MDKKNQEDIEKYWEEKEQEIGEKIIGKDMSEYLGGFGELKEKLWGLLYYSQKAFYFQTFPRRSWFASLLGMGGERNQNDVVNFRIMWLKVKDIYLPARKKSLLSFLSPTDYRVFIKYQIDNKEDTLVFAMYSSKSRDKFVDCYNQSKQNI